MSEYGDRADRTEQLRSNFAQQGIQGVAEDAARTERAQRRVHTVVAALVTIAALVATIYRFVSGAPVGVWVAFYAGGVALGASGFVLVRCGWPRLGLAVAVLGCLALGLGDSAGGLMAARS
ncbi:hypothetical protein AB0D04_27620 [Streptomyces sp. NPDC048483]|uniref:hypothetical protein n=1 Tax=Streptomyces sp. NPDC048483 TaxID=3154927 RepID=UPI00342BD15C